MQFKSSNSFYSNLIFVNVGGRVTKALKIKSYSNYNLCTFQCYARRGGEGKAGKGSGFDRIALPWGEVLTTDYIV